MVGAARWGHLVVVAAVACACGALAPAAEASLSVPTGGPPVMITSPSASFPSVSSAIAAFERTAGGGDNGTIAGEQPGGFRHVTWDQIALGGSDPGSTTIDSGHVIVPTRNRLQPSGLELGPEIAVSGDGFESVASAQFTPFSPANVWGPFNTDTAEFDIAAPAGQGSTPTPAQTRGLGIVFLNPNGSTPAQIQYYNGAIPLLPQPLPAPSGTTTFAGMLFPDPVVTRVVVTFGSSIFTWDGSTVTNGGPSSVAGDDVVLSEPAPARQAVSATAGVPISPVLDTFTNDESRATATIDWGDGSRTVGTILPLGNDTFNVTGSHSYALTGSYTATVTVTDFSTPADEQTSNTVIQVGPRSSATNVSCSPSPVAVTASTTCTAIVSDAGAGGPFAPTGLVGFSSPTPGAAFTNDSGCELGATATPGVSMCQVLFTPSELPPNQAKVLVAYDGDGAHATSAGIGTVAVRAQHCTVKTLGARLNRRPPGLGVLVTCDARANLQITVNAVAPRKGAFKAIKLQFGTLKTSVGAGRPTVLLIKPASGVLPILRAANKRHQRVSLKLTLVASSHATRATTTTRVSAVRLR
jgi:hypothetical protein